MGYLVDEPFILSYRLRTMFANRKKIILVPIFNRAHFGRLRPVLEAIQKHPLLDLRVIAGLSAAYGSFIGNIKHSRPHSWKKSLPWYLRAKLISIAGLFKPEIYCRNDFLAGSLAKAGFRIDSFVPFFFDGGVSEVMAKSVGFGLVKIVDELKRLKPDIVFINADRFEMMSVALAASYLNILIAHNEGGDVSGTIDESVRHAITKLAHIHFTSTEKSRRRVIQMGENPDNVFTVGSPAIDAIKNLDSRFLKNIFAGFDSSKPYLLVLIHSVATETQKYNADMIKNAILAADKFEMQTVFLGSNIDAGSADIGNIVRKLRDYRLKNMFFGKTLPPEDFYGILADASCLVGNSSSFIREGAYFGTPAVDIGSRQNNRERGINVISVGNDIKEIESAVEKQLQHGKYKPDLRFGDGKASEKIASILASFKPRIQKKFYDLD